MDYSEVEMGCALGKGSFATVIRGKWNGKDVALKRIRLPGGYDTEELANMQEIAIQRYANVICLFETFVIITVLSLQHKGS